MPAKTLSDAARMMTPGIPVRIMTLGTRSGAGSGEAGRADALRAADAMAGFESGGRRLTTRLIAGEYIKYSSRFPDEFGSRGEMPAVTLAEAVKRVALVAERGTSVRLSFGRGKVAIEAGPKAGAGQGNRPGQVARVSSWYTRGAVSRTVQPRVPSSPPPAASRFRTQSQPGP